jgi:hypothetical protein
LTSSHTEFGEQGGRLRRHAARPLEHAAVLGPVKGQGPFGWPRRRGQPLTVPARDGCQILAVGTEECSWRGSNKRMGHKKERKGQARRWQARDFRNARVSDALFPVSLSPRPYRERQAETINARGRGRITAGQISPRVCNDQCQGGGPSRARMMRLLAGRRRLERRADWRTNSDARQSQ